MNTFQPRPPIRHSLGGLFNQYLVPEREELTLIDTGLPPLLPAILRTVKFYQRPIRRILLTHGHGDHVRNLDSLRSLFPQAEVMMHALDVHYLRRFGLKTRPTRFLEGGEQLGPIRVLATPGHSLGHVSFFDERDSTLYAGDAFINVPHLRVTTEFNLLFPMPSIVAADPVAALASARKLADLTDICWLATGHGPVLQNPLESMRLSCQRAPHPRPLTLLEQWTAEVLEPLLLRPSRSNGE